MPLAQPPATSGTALNPKMLYCRYRRRQPRAWHRL